MVKHSIKKMMLRGHFIYVIKKIFKLNKKRKKDQDEKKIIKQGGYNIEMESLFWYFLLVDDNFGTWSFKISSTDCIFFVEVRDRRNWKEDSGGNAKNWCSKEFEHRFSSPWTTMWKFMQLSKFFQPNSNYMLSVF